MKRLKFLSGQVFVLAQYNFITFTRAINVRLFEGNTNILNSNLVGLSTFHSLLREREIFKDKSKNSTAGKTQENKTSVVSVSQPSEKKKTLQKIKSLTVRPEINYNDLQIKLKQIHKFIIKGVTVSVKVDNPKNLAAGFEGIFNHIQKSITEQKLSAKMTKTGPNIIIYPIAADDKADKKSEQKEEGSSFSDLNSESEGKL